MSRDAAPKDNGWRLVRKCWHCLYFGSKTLVCPSCGELVSEEHTVVARWVSTRKWWQYLFIELGDGGYWEEKK